MLCLKERTENEQENSRKTEGRVYDGEKQQHKKKRGKVQHIRGSPKKRKIFGKAVFSSESIPGKMLADVKI